MREIESEIAGGKFIWEQSLEDVHMNIERRAATGSPSPESVECQIARWRQLLQTE